MSPQIWGLIFERAKPLSSVLSGAIKTLQAAAFLASTSLAGRRIFSWTGYSVPLRAKVIDRWRELEAQVAKPVQALA